METPELATTQFQTISPCSFHITDSTNQLQIENMQKKKDTIVVLKTYTFSLLLFLKQ